MAREIHSDTLGKIDQKPDISDNPAEYEGDIVVAGSSVLDDKEYLDQIAFSKEPITIILNPSSEKNAATSFPVWVNGKGAEVLMNGRWTEMGYLPIGRPITIRRMVLEVIVRAKVDTINTVQSSDPDSERVDNRVTRFTAPVHSFSVVSNQSPRDAAWLAELATRNY